MIYEYNILSVSFLKEEAIKRILELHEYCPELKQTSNVTGEWKYKTKEPLHEKTIRKINKSNVLLFP